MAVHVKRETYEQQAPLAPWVLAIARYKLADYFRVRRHEVSAVILNTEALIEVLVSTTRGRRRKRHLSHAVVLTLVACAVLAIAVEGMRPSLLAALVDGRVPCKLLFTSFIAGFALLSVARLGVPGRTASAWLWALPWAGLASAMLLASPWEFTAVSRAEWIARVWTPAVPECFGVLMLLGALSWPLLLRSARSLAPTRPRLYAVQLGLASSALAATAYTLACQQDDPLFVSVWYSTSMLCSAAFSGIAAPRYLTW